MKRILTAAALAAALLSSAPRAAAACPYKVGPFGRYIAPAIVKGMTATNENQIEVWCSGGPGGGDPAGGRGHRASDPPQSRPGAASSGRRGKAAGGAGCFRAGSVQAVQYGAAVCCCMLA